MTGDHRPDNRTDRQKWQAIDSDEHASVQGLLRLLPPVKEDDLPEQLRVFRTGTAQLKLELLAMCALGPRVLVGEEKGAEVPISSLVEDGAFPFQLAEAPPSAEKTSVLFLLHPSVSIDSLRETLPSAELLATHAIGTTDLQALLQGDTATFQRRRTDRLLLHLRSFLAEQAALTPADRDRPPIDAYFTEESA